MSRQPERISSTDQPTNGPVENCEFSPDERAWLLKLAHQAIEAVLDKQAMSISPFNSHLAEPRGAFTTLYRRGELRGCVGYVTASAPLYQTVIDTAGAAAFADTRFPPVARDELPYLSVSLSVLSPLKVISPEELVIGKHGLIVSKAGYRGLLLPQVPIEHEWDRIEFLEHTCRKAGLPPDGWRNGATLEAFTAEIFDDAG